MSDQREVMNAAREAVKEAVLIASGSVKKEQVLQGHVDTGRSLRSYEEVYEVSGDQVRGMVIAENYLIFVDTGIPKDKVNYQIEILISWFKRKGLPTKEAIRAAWATRFVHKKKDGIPTLASRRFSKTGERTGFINAGLDRVEKELEEAFERRLGIEIDLVISRQPQEIDPIIYAI